MVVGLALSFIGLNPIKCLVVTAVINGVVAVAIIAAMALPAASQKVMGEHSSGWLPNRLVCLASSGIAVAAIGLLLSTL